MYVLTQQSQYATNTMKKIIIFINHHKILTICLLSILILGFYLVIRLLFLDSTIEINNLTSKSIQYQAFQYFEKSPILDLSDEKEYGNFKSVYSINQKDSNIVRLDSDYWKQSPVIVNISIENSESLNPFWTGNFKEIASSPNKKAYCSYRIDIYPNRKTIVTPTNKRFCIKPMYYYESN